MSRNPKNHLPMSACQDSSRKLPKLKKVCSACHQRKVKCDLYDKSSQSEKCTSCINQGYDCVVYIRKKRVLSKIASNATSIPIKLPSFVRTHEADLTKKLNEIKLDPERFVRIFYHQNSRFKGYIGTIKVSPLTSKIFDDFFTKHSLSKKPELDEIDYQMMVAAGCFNLPSQELCWKLITAYFDKMHPIAPFINKTRFMKDYKDLTKVPSILLLQAVLFVGSMVYSEPTWTEQDKEQMAKMSQIFFKRAKTLYDLNSDMLEPIPLIQSLMLLSWNTNPVYQKNSVYFIYISIGVAQTFGMHRDLTNMKELSTYEKKTFKLLWWYIYIRDRSLSVALGRPTTIQDDDCDVSPLIAEDMYDDIEDQGATAYPLEQIQIENMLQSVKLANVSQIIVKNQSIIDRLALNGEPFLHLIKQDDFLLSKWFENLPASLRYNVQDESSHSIYGALITGYYYSLLINLHKVNIIRTSKVNSQSMHLFDSIDPTDSKSSENELNVSDRMLTKEREPSPDDHANDEYYPSWGITFQAAYAVYQIFHKQHKHNYINDKPHHFVFFMFNSANLMTYHLSNKDKRVARIANQVVRDIIRMFDEVKNVSVNIESMHYVLKTLYQNKPYQSIMLRSLLKTDAGGEEDVGPSLSLVTIGGLSSSILKMDPTGVSAKARNVRTVKAIINKRRRLSDADANDSTGRAKKRRNAGNFIEEGKLQESNMKPEPTSSTALPRPQLGPYHSHQNPHEHQAQLINQQGFSGVSQTYNEPPKFNGNYVQRQNVPLQKKKSNTDYMVDQLELHSGDSQRIQFLGQDHLDVMYNELDFDPVDNDFDNFRPDKLFLNTFLAPDTNHNDTNDVQEQQYEYQLNDLGQTPKELQRNGHLEQVPQQQQHYYHQTANQQTEMGTGTNNINDDTNFSWMLSEINNNWHPSFELPVVSRASSNAGVQPASSDTSNTISNQVSMGHTDNKKLPHTTAMSTIQGHNPQKIRIGNGQLSNRADDHHTTKVSASAVGLSVNSGPGNPAQHHHNGQERQQRLPPLSPLQYQQQHHQQQHHQQHQERQPQLQQHPSFFTGYGPQSQQPQHPPDPQLGTGYQVSHRHQHQHQHQHQHSASPQPFAQLIPVPAAIQQHHHHQQQLSESSKQQENDNSSAQQTLSPIHYYSEQRHYQR